MRTLGYCGPVGVRLNAVTQVGVGEDIEAREGRALRLQDLVRGRVRVRVRVRARVKVKIEVKVEVEVEAEAKVKVTVGRGRIMLAKASPTSSGSPCMPA